MVMKAGWELILVNRDHPLPDDFQVNLTALPNGEAVDARIYDALGALLKAAETDKIVMHVSWGHRSYRVQELLVDINVRIRKDRGMSEEAARAHVKKIVATPGESEHQLGLAVDFQADTTQSTSNEIYAWLVANAHKYGFILRYPEDKVDITKYNYEPWHYRYVGPEAAGEIFDKGLCLEEYLGDV